MNLDKTKQQITETFKREGVHDYLLTCSCFNMSKRAAEAFSLRYPDRILPEIVKGRDRLYKLAKTIGNDHILAISKLSGKFMYYVRLEGNKIIEEVDLQKGTRIK